MPISLAVLAATLMACSESPVGSAPAPAPASDPSAGPILSAPSWSDMLGATSAPAGWQVTPCETPMLLCVEAEGELVGTVESFAAPVADYDFPTDESAESLLAAWVSDHYAAIDRDRAIGYPDLTFSAEPPVAAAVGSLPGLRYGYTTAHANGTPVDRAIGYVATDGDYFYVFVTGMISGDPSGSIADEAALNAFEPHLAKIIEGLKL
ncbi:MAG: hypothetical protein F6J97_15465 [Leptolyngbya sp. SIO4C1]|nr:hypothetical protein [Leptolyngbya sp. SIO4C1]